MKNKLNNYNFINEINKFQVCKPLNHTNNQYRKFKIFIVVCIYYKLKQVTKRKLLKF